MLDVALLPDAKRADVQGLALFADTFAAPALSLSPHLFRLPNGSASDATTFLSELDRLCAETSSLSILRSPLELATLAAHLRQFLRVETSAGDFLLRFFDPQMLGACLRCLSPAQHGAFLQPVSSWWTCDYEGTLQDHASRAPATETMAAPPFPLKLDDAQLAQLLEHTFPIALACQLRQLEPQFDALLGKAEQARFVARTLQEARASGMHMESELTDYCFTRWRDQLDAQP